MKSIFHRTSIRKYKDLPVEEEKIEKMLQAAMAAPSARNQQPWQFYVVRNKDIIHALTSCSPYVKFAYDAPLIFVPCYKEDLPSKDYANIDMSACVENLLLEADYLGLGCTWCGISPNKERMDNVRNVLNIPSHLHAFALIPCGYPAEEKIQQDRYDRERIIFVD